MAIWRVLKPLSKGFNKVIPVGTITGLEWVDEKGLGRLQAGGAVTRISAPPLHKLPGWNLRSKRLREAGVTTAEQFLELGDAELAERIGADPRTVAKWRAELLARWLAFPKERRR